MRKSIVIGSRGSKLALIQSEFIAQRIRETNPGIEVRIETISTKGDRIIDKPIAEIGGKGIFTQELDSALADGAIDLAVHSLKDLPTEQPEGITLAATPKRATPYDALVCTKWKSLEALPSGAVVGTSSVRRKAQLLAAHSDLNVVDLRGNVDTRIRKVEEGTIDAAVLACAGLERLSRADAIAEVLPANVMLPAPGQGALGIQARSDDSELLEALKVINHPATEAETIAERTLLLELGGGCQMPMGALARVDGDDITLDTCVCGLDGVRVLRVHLTGHIRRPHELGQRAATHLLRDGAEELIGELA